MLESLSRFFELDKLTLLFPVLTRIHFFDSRFPIKNRLLIQFSFQNQFFKSISPLRIDFIIDFPLKIEYFNRIKNNFDYESLVEKSIDLEH